MEDEGESTANSTQPASIDNLFAPSPIHAEEKELSEINVSSARTHVALPSDDEEEGTEEQEFPKHDSNSDQSEELTYLRMMLEDLALHESLASALSQMNVSSIEDLIHAVQHSPDELRAIGMTDQDLLNINNYVDKHVEDEGESTANSTQPASIVGV